MESADLEEWTLMGNKNSSMANAADSGTTQEEDGGATDALTGRTLKLVYPRGVSNII